MIDNNWNTVSWYMIQTFVGGLWLSEDEFLAANDKEAIQEAQKLLNTKRLGEGKMIRVCKVVVISEEIDPLELDNL